MKLDRARATPVGSSILVAACLCLLALAARPAGAQGPGAEFDHTGTRFILTGSHESVACAGCHGQGIFEGTPTACGYCHDGSGTRAESGKPFSHIQTLNLCEDCHTTFTWLEVRFDHVGVSGSCAACHNGTQAEGKPFEHITTGADCDLCHNDIAWSVVRFDHSGITEPCSFCHNGTSASGKNPGHLQTSDECDVCHRTRSWRPASFDHTGVMESCSSCHNGVEATGIPTNHFTTMQECDTCHTTRAWQPDTFSHMSGNYPGDHRVNLGCTDCHPGNTEPVVYTDDPGLAPDCAGCHRNDYKPGPHKKHENPDATYLVEELRDCTGSCHVYTDATLTQIQKSRSGEHRVSQREF